MGFHWPPLGFTCVSAASGNDANSCHCTQPCRSFHRAHDQTLSDGQVTVLDPGDYGTLTITKSISIVNDSGGAASIMVSGGAVGVLVNAPASGYVNLRGLTIQGVGFGGGTGVGLNTAFSFTMENCVVRNHTNRGIFLAPSVNSQISISNTLVADNGGRAGIELQAEGSAAVIANFNGVELYNNSGAGLFANGGVSQGGTVSVTVTDSVAANNTGVGGISGGFSVHTVTAPTTLTLVRSVATRNGIGLAADQPSVMRVGQSVVTANTTSWSGLGVQSYGDNYINGNGDNDPAPPFVAPK